VEVGAPSVVAGHRLSRYLAAYPVTVLSAPNPALCGKAGQQEASTFGAEGNLFSNHI
jgi:hypothetical protein